MPKMFNIVSGDMRPIKSDRIERWLGKERCEDLSRAMKGWYGPPINLTDCPGSVWIDRDGDFVGSFDRGFFYTALDSLADYINRLRKNFTYDPSFLGAGFASIGDALSRASQGNTIMPAGGSISKTGTTGVVAAANSLWAVGASPAAGAIGSAAPGGRACVDSTTGGLLFTNPSSGTMHLTGADFSSLIINNSLLIYDRIFDVAKTMNSTATESVTGVPTRYQNTTAGTADYVGGNFLFVETITVLAATAHNWTTCLYRDQDNNDAVTLPSLTGVSGCIANRLDMPTSTWFAPLAAGDVGIMDLNQIQCSAAVATGTVDFVIGHPLGIMNFPVINSVLPFDWLTNRNQAPRVFDDACISFIELPKPATTATTYSGSLYLTVAA